MNWAQFKDPVSYMCLADAGVASWSLTQEVAGLSPFTVVTNILFAEFSEKHLGKTPLGSVKRLCLDDEVAAFCWRV